MRAKPMSLAEIEEFLDREFPQIHEGGRVYAILDAAPERARIRIGIEDRHLRPGGTVSGPTMMALVDLGAYVAILASLGPVILAVTTSLNINFLRRPRPGPLVADCRLIKLGRRLAVAEAEITAEGHPDLVAHATATYALPLVMEPRSESAAKP
ncbi:MAG: PaaI family thioesterase [Pseudomonadota bacterium]|nr:PaaI family thioesterase [Pseudomonadota bacterium]